jgi:hypothetical protein
MPSRKRSSVGKRKRAHSRKASRKSSRRRTSRKMRGGVIECTNQQQIGNVRLTRNGPTCTAWYQGHSEVFTLPREANKLTNFVNNPRINND